MKVKNLLYNILEIKKDLIDWYQSKKDRINREHYSNQKKYTHDNVVRVKNKMDKILKVIIFLDYQLENLGYKENSNKSNSNSNNKQNNNQINYKKNIKFKKVERITDKEEELIEKLLIIFKSNQIISPDIKRFIGYLEKFPKLKESYLTIPGMRIHMKKRAIYFNQTIIPIIKWMEEKLTKNYTKKSNYSNKNRKNYYDKKLKIAKIIYETIKEYVKDEQSNISGITYNNNNNSNNNNFGGSQFINIPNYGRRKVRYQKNGRPYVIVNKKKLKL